MYKTILLTILAVGLAACGGGSQATKFPGTPDGAKALLTEFQKPGADTKKLTMELKPETADYKAFYKEESTAKRAEDYFAKLWAGGNAVVAPKEGQTELKLASATPKDLSESTGQYAEFPTSMQALGDELNPNITVYAFKFVKPGETSGMAYEGLTYVNGKWKLFPKPWQFHSAN
jgi:hypothetical protein